MSVGARDEDRSADRAAVREARMLLADVDPAAYPHDVAASLGMAKRALDDVHRRLRNLTEEPTP